MCPLYLTILSKSIYFRQNILKIDFESIFSPGKASIMFPKSLIFFNISDFGPRWGSRWIYCASSHNQKKDNTNYFLIFIVIQLQLYAFSPHPSTPPQLNPPPSPTSTLPLDFVHVSFIVVPIIPSSHCPHPTPTWLLLDCS